MSTLFEKLFDFFSEFLYALKFWHVLGEDEIGIIQRLGMYQRDLAHGFNWKWPVIEEANITSGALDSTALVAQTLTTSDSHQVTLRGVLTYRVIDARKYILGCENAESVVNDVGTCVVAEVVPTMTLADVLKDDVFAKELQKKMRARAKKWGIHVESFGLADRVKTRVYRIIGSELGGE